MTCPASFTQNGFWGRNDDGSQTTATWKGLQNSDFTQAVDTNFRIRFQIQEGAGCAKNNVVWRLQYNLAGAGWVDCSASSNVVRASASANFTDGEATTDQLTGGSGTFQGGAPSTGGMDEGDCNAGGSSMDISASGTSECEFCVQIVGTDVTNGQTLQLRATDAGNAFASYTQTPTITVSEPANYSMPADVGSYAETGIDASLLLNRVVAGAVGSYALTGNDVSFSKLMSYSLPAEVGSYAVTGIASGLYLGRALSADAASYALTGVDATLTYTQANAYSLTADVGSFALTGIDAGLLLGRVVTADAGSLAITGVDTTLTYTQAGRYSLTADVGTYALTGVDAGLYIQRVVVTEEGVFAITGVDAGLTYAPAVAPEVPAVRTGGGTSKHKRRKRIRYWWEEENLPKKPEEIVIELPMVEPSPLMPTFRFDAEQPAPEVDLTPAMQTMRKRVRMKMAAALAMQLLDD